MNSHSTIESGKDLPKTTQKNQSGGEIGIDKKSDESSKQNYSLSMWLYLNAQDNTTKVKHIFNYGGEPKIEFINIENGEHVNKCKFTLFQNDPIHETQNSKPSVYLTSLELQKWNHIVFNYNNNKCDLFINGHFEYSAIATTIKNKTKQT